MSDQDSSFSSPPPTGDEHYYPTDWKSDCEARCRKTGKRCPHKATWQIPNTIASHAPLDGNHFLVSGRPARLCASHHRNWMLRAKRLLSLPLIDGGHLSPYNHYGVGSIVVKQDHIKFSAGAKAVIPDAWGVYGWSGKVPAGLLDKLPRWEGRPVVSPATGLVIHREVSGLRSHPGLSDLIDTTPLSSFIPINRTNLRRLFGSNTIEQYGGSFRMCRMGVLSKGKAEQLFSVPISPEDAVHIIDELNLTATKPPGSRRLIIWGRKR